MATTDYISSTFTRYVNKQKSDGGLNVHSDTLHVLIGCEPECSWVNYNGHNELAL